MRGAVLVAIAATMGSMLQGWDSSTIAGTVLYIKEEFDLQDQPTIEGLIVAMSLIGGTAITTFSGPLSDSVGRRPMMIISSVLYFVSGLIMLWAPSVYMLLLGRLFDGFGIGIAVTLIPIYISETAPSEIRGQLNTIPQFANSGGMFLSYCLVFGMSLMESASWRLMLGVLSLPSLLYFMLTVFFLPESPRWLVSKGRMNEARQVLQRLYGREDVSGELALLVEGLSVGGETSIKEVIVLPVKEINPYQQEGAETDKIRLYETQMDYPGVGKTPTGQNIPNNGSRWGSVQNQSVPLMDPIVTMFGSVSDSPLQRGSMLSTVFPNFGSVFSTVDNTNDKNLHLDLETQGDCDDYASDDGGDQDESLETPLLSPEASAIGKDHANQASHGSHLSTRLASKLMQEDAGEPINSTDIGSGWKLAWKWSGREGEDGVKGVKRIYLHQDSTVDGSRQGSALSISGVGYHEEGELSRAAALVSQSVLFSQDMMGRTPEGLATVQPPRAATSGPSWRDLSEPGVRRALVVGIGLQVLEQLSGINGVLYYAPQILKQAGVDVLLSGMGISTDSATFLISSIMTFTMLPCLAVSMKLMDVAGRRSLLLSTIPILALSLLVLVVSSIFNLGSVASAVISTIGVMVYQSIFCMAYGVIPNIMCSEIFPTKVRGLCITICALTYWAGNITVTYSLPVLLNSIGLAGLFSIYALGCIVSWIFVFLRVPETKGMPLEVISELFAAGAKQASGDNDS
ncbi:monosaccharide-sensing protein 2-like [Rhodamnia argentea]|uniref:Monosaccharide-sensing protein 2-like n=1 Tax=Rhodamnia argentea TaxID=178133 RepID=A0A8B8NPA1_9MYRT|nr:monosaccharide-sensing protein 2-like [Rhodamnia argentea]